MALFNGLDLPTMKPNEAEDTPVLRVPDIKRIKNARKERANQLKEWQQYDRRMIKESEKMQKRGLASGPYSNGKIVKFPQSLIFLEAAARGDLDEVRELLKSGVCPDVSNEDGLTALHQCCIDNNVEMCLLLLRFGANPNSRDTEKWTPLHASATCHHTELCKILIDHGADLFAMNVDGNMPYECCMPGPTLNLIESEMDSRGITQEQIDDCHRIPECEMLSDMEHLYRTGGDFNSSDNQGAAPLHVSAACGYEEVVLFLLKRGAIIDLCDKDGWQAIHIAACWGQLEIIQLLVNFGADILAETRNGETVFDICEDLEMHTRLIEMKQEVERKKSQHAQNQQGMENKQKKAADLVRRCSSTNHRTASIRRSSMREKKMMSWKEAKQEAEMRGVTLTSDELLLSPPVKNGSLIPIPSSNLSQVPPVTVTDNQLKSHPFSPTLPPNHIGSPRQSHNTQHSSLKSKKLKEDPELQITMPSPSVNPRHSRLKEDTSSKKITYPTYTPKEFVPISSQPPSPAIRARTNSYISPDKNARTSKSLTNGLPPNTDNKTNSLNRRNPSSSKPPSNHPIHDQPLLSPETIIANNNKVNKKLSPHTQDRQSSNVVSPQPTRKDPLRSINHELDMHNAYNNPSPMTKPNEPTKRLTYHPRPPEDHNTQKAAVRGNSMTRVRTKTRSTEPSHSYPSNHRNSNSKLIGYDNLIREKGSGKCCIIM